MRNLNMMKKMLALLLAAVCLLALGACKDEKGNGAASAVYDRHL